jgi:hypothetical protein
LSLPKAKRPEHHGLSSDRPERISAVFRSDVAFWIDPTEQLIAVLMLLAPERRLYYRHLLRPLVYGAITGPP